jgi:hypothetical protein
MLKTFTLNKIEEEILSDTEGKMTFELCDEAGVIRSVWGTTKLDQNGLPVSISANKTREHPLIQCLFNSQLNETIKIEFTQYNDIFERKDEEQKTPSVEELINEMQKKPLRMGELLEFTD